MTPLEFGPYVETISLPLSKSFSFDGVALTLDVPAPFTTSSTAFVCGSV